MTNIKTTIYIFLLQSWFILKSDKLNYPKDLYEDLEGLQTQINEFQNNIDNVSLIHSINFIVDSNRLFVEN